MRSLVVPGLVALALTACSSPKHYGFLEGEPNAPTIQRTLRANVREFGDIFLARTTNLGVQVFVEADTPEQRMRATVFANRLSAEVSQATLHADPVASALDLTTLLHQLQGWLAEGGDGAEYLGDRQEDARRLIAEFIEHSEELLATSSSEFVRTEISPSARSWAAEFPMRHATMSRVTVGPLIAQLGRERGSSMFDMAGSVEDGMRSIETRMDVMAREMPARLVLQSALVIEAVIGRLRVEELRASVDGLLVQVDDLGEAVTAEREAVLADVERQRVETLAHVERVVHDELDNGLQALESMRAQTVADVAELHAATMETVGAELSTALTRLDATAHSLAGRPFDEQRSEMVAEIEGALERSIDALFVRALALVVVAGLALIVAAALLRRRPA